MEFKKEWVAPALAGALPSFVAGYFVCKKRLDNKLDSAMDTVAENISSQLKLDFDRAAIEHPLNEQIKAAEEAMRRKDAVIGELRNELEAVTAEIDHIRNTNPPESDVVVEPIVGDILWDQEAEEASRTPGDPYIIHVNEFEDNMKKQKDLALTYYVGDHVLVDEDMSPVYNVNHVVGNLVFGKGSGQSDVVYIRNEKLGYDYEVTREDGTYEAAVQGIIAEESADHDDEIRHSQIPRFRQ